MPVTYTNRKGVTYYLCRGTTKAGRPYYYFAREPKGDPMEAIPEGFKISESVNGFVTLARDQPLQIRPEELAAVEAAVKCHPKAGKYRVGAKHNRIEIYERVGPDADELLAMFRGMGGLSLDQENRLREVQNGHARYEAVMRFILADEERRTFRAQRRCYLGSVDDWIDISEPGRLDKLARKLTPKLGTEGFFELY